MLVPVEDFKEFYSKVVTKATRKKKLSDARRYDSIALLQRVAHDRQEGFDYHYWKRYLRDSLR